MGKIEQKIALLLFCFVFGIGILLVPSIGPAWDEPDNIHSGGVYLNFFRSGFKRQVLEDKNASASYFYDKIFSQETSLLRYPPVPNMVGTGLVVLGERLGWKSTNMHIITAFHIATVFFFALLILYVFRFGKLLGLSTGASLFASLFTFLHPTLFGHGLSNLKDTAQVSLFTVSLYYLARSTLLKRRSDVWKGAVVWGLAMATKINGIYVPIIWIVWDAGTRLHDVRFSLRGVRNAVFFHLKSYIYFFAIGLIIAFLVWPYLWFDPIHRIMEVVRYFTTVGQGYKIFWNGVTYVVGVGKPLWWYPWFNVVIVTPVLLAVLGIFGFLLTFLKRRPSHRILLIWFTIPMLRAILPNAAYYDGIRHFMEVLPAFTLLAAVGLDVLFRSKKFHVRSVFWIVSLVVLSHLAFIQTQYFPYATGYYNMLAKDANRKFDRDIEAISIREAMEHLHSKYKGIRLWAPIGGHLTWYYLVPPDRYVYYPADADSIILINKSSHVSYDDFQPIVKVGFRLDHVVRRGDAVFAWVYRKQ